MRLYRSRGAAGQPLPLASVVKQCFEPYGCTRCSRVKSGPPLAKGGVVWGHLVQNVVRCRDTKAGIAPKSIRPWVCTRGKRQPRQRLVLGRGIGAKKLGRRPENRSQALSDSVSCHAPSLRLSRAVTCPRSRQDVSCLALVVSVTLLGATRARGKVAERPFRSFSKAKPNDTAR